MNKALLRPKVLERIVVDGGEVPCGHTQLTCCMGALLASLR